MEKRKKKSNQEECNKKWQRRPRSVWTRDGGRTASGKKIIEERKKKEKNKENAMNDEKVSRETNEFFPSLIRWKNTKKIFLLFQITYYY